MKYKVGDHVRIKSLDWYEKNKTNGVVELIGNDYRGYNFIEAMAVYYGRVMTITNVIPSNNSSYEMEEDGQEYYWTADMIEGLVEEEMKSENELLDEYEELTDRAFKGGYEKCKSDIKLNGFQLPEGYIFKDENGNVINTTKIVLEKKKKEYPKTYEECCDILRIETNRTIEYDDCLGYRDITQYDIDLLTQLKYLRKLLICRDAYWKIAGDEMELGKPWEPDWTISADIKYVIEVYRNNVRKNSQGYSNTLLAFPTPEMRDAFKDNFDLDIEFCKEFL